MYEHIKNSSAVLITISGTFITTEESRILNVRLQMDTHDVLGIYLSYTCRKYGLYESCWPVAKDKTKYVIL